MMTTRTAAQMHQDLVTDLAARLEGSLLGSDHGFGAAPLIDAANFVLAAGARRRPGEALIAVDSVGGPVGQRLTRIVAINDDMPFLVDSIAATVAEFGLAVDRLVHPVVAVRRDHEGKLLALPDDVPSGDVGGGDVGGGGVGAGLSQESIVYIETDRADARTRVRLRAALAVTLDDVHAAVDDWLRLRAAMTADADRLVARGAEYVEPAELLRWLSDDKLTQLGHVVRGRDGRQSDALGVCRTSGGALLQDESYKRAFACFDRAPERPLLIVKANMIARVHRRVPLDLFIVPVREGGKVTALSVHGGIWTSAALAALPGNVPLLRRQLGTIMQRLDFEPHGHAGKALVHALTSLPHDVLIGFDTAELERVATTMISLVDRPRSHLVLVRSPLDRHLFAFVWLPRDALSTEIRLEIQAMIAEAARAKVLDWSLEVQGSLATIRSVLDIRAGKADVDEAALAARLRAVVRGWPEAVEAELAESEKRGRAAAVAARFAEAFPLAYRTAYGPAEAAADIGRLRALATHDAGPDSRIARDARLHCLGGCPQGQLRLKLYQRHGALPLSDAVPMLENFGFRVRGETPTLLDDGELGAIHDFLLELPAGLTSDVLLARARDIECAIAAVLNGAAEDDPFNRLITGTGLAACEAVWLRAWFRYLRQAGMTYGIATVVDALQAAPAVAHGLIALFVARHDPAYKAAREAGVAAAGAAIREGLAAVSAINDDRLLRRYQGVVEAIVRTNAFVPARSGEPDIALAFKLDSAKVPKLARPVPWREIFVYSRRVEGIHLRAGAVARGGLRWSDRRDDFRTEVLGLMKAQRVKNAVIVPTGAKGGFYPKRLPDPVRAETGGRDGWLAEGKASYQLFVRSLLSLTDNIVAGKVVHPRSMVICDGDDPYFVVAADKGTASFSDVANAIAARQEFWLDDAFASGGSKGYDHKAMGITARGAWLSVRRHFLEMGTDVQRDLVSVVGCGDMSGDVFGNGMLLSKSIKLVAAFDHRHIFIDPDPDPAGSWAERARLFALPRSSWEDYDASLISQGGGVFSRSLKQIPLSAEARAALGLASASVDPETLIRAILMSQVDLIWFGGIGTYVKAEAESHLAVGDPVNDTLRIDAGEVRANVIGEGANLGCTQAGRIVFALGGGRINTDFIDNSAGVDCSDNEVNIKIALASAKRAGRLSEPGRVKLLGEMTDNVAALVLEDNRLQALALSIAEAGGPDAMPSYLRLIELLEEHGEIDRRTDGLADADVLARRAIDGQGLTRPELAVILSSAKLALQGSLERSDLPEDEGLVEELIAAFPTAMHHKFNAEIREHRLRREIIATKLANRMINRMGLIHPFELVEEEGATPEQFGAAFVAAERLFGMARIWQAIETGQMPETARILLFDRAAAALRPHIADLLRAGAGRVAPSTLVAELAPAIAKLDDCAQTTLGDEARAQSRGLRDELAAAGAPAAEAAMVAHLFDLDGAVGLAGLSRDTGIDAPSLAAAFVDLGMRLGLDWAQGKAARMNPTDPWERLLVGGLARDFQQMRLEFLARVRGQADDPQTAVAEWTKARSIAIEQFRAIVRRAQTAVGVTPAMLAQLASQARSLLAR